MDVTHPRSLLPVQVVRRAGSRAASLVEYALLLALIALVAFAAITFVGGTTASEFVDISSSITGP